MLPSAGSEKGPNAVNGISLGLTDFLLGFGQIITKGWTLGIGDQGKVVQQEKNQVTTLVHQRSREVKVVSSISKMKLDQGGF